MTLDEELKNLVSPLLMRTLTMEQTRKRALDWMRRVLNDYVALEADYKSAIEQLAANGKISPDAAEMLAEIGRRIDTNNDEFSLFMDATAPRQLVIPADETARVTTTIETTNTNEPPPAA